MSAPAAPRQRYRAPPLSGNPVVSRPSACPPAAAALRRAMRGVLTESAPAAAARRADLLHDLEQRTNSGRPLPAFEHTQGSCAIPWSHFQPCTNPGTPLSVPRALRRVPATRVPGTKKEGRTLCSPLSKRGTYYFAFFLS